MCENMGGHGRAGPDFSDFFRNGPKWSLRALGLLFGVLGYEPGPWAAIITRCGWPCYSLSFPGVAGPWGQDPGLGKALQAEAPPGAIFTKFKELLVRER